jgi:hypothetical protein
LQSKGTSRNRVVIGGGPAGFFAAIRAAELDPTVRVILLEKSMEPLLKVLHSGGGRCNLTHDCPDPRDLAGHYPRGARELLGPFSRFSCTDTLEWFHRRGIATTTEADGRIFPATHDARTVVDGLLTAASRAGVHLRTGCGVDAIRLPSGPGENWTVTAGDSLVSAERVAVATGSSATLWRCLGELGHRVVPPVPSLFAFRIASPLLDALAGLSVPDAIVTIPGLRLSRQGPLLLTHWGLSGPVILTLSAWAARYAADCGYRFDLDVNWTGESREILQDQLLAFQSVNGRLRASTHPAVALPVRLWGRLTDGAGIPADRPWAQVGRKPMADLLQGLIATRLSVQGKSRHREEFVTAGGVDLRDVHCETFESRIHPGLFIVGEALNIDAVTGGFNFQAAWTTGYLAGTALAAESRQDTSG